jgi:triacylglycerol lipase
MPFNPLTDIPTLADLVPPNLDYPYFQGIQGPAFDPDAQGYSRVNAWWLAEASLLAYGGRELADPLLERPTLLQRDRVQLASVPGPDDNGVLLLFNERFVIAAFRGTRVPGLQNPMVFLNSLQPSLADVVTDLRFRTVPFDQGRVHEGYLTSFQQLEQGLRDRLGSLQDRRIWFTGHSLGGALATLAAARFGGFQGLYTFGSPRLGNRDFAAWFDGQPCFRVVHHDDIVPRLPPPWVPLLPTPATFAHVGKLIYIDQDGTVRQDVSPDSLTDVAAGTLNLTNVIQGVVTSARDNLAILTHPHLVPALSQVQVPRSALTDHGPIYYAWFLQRDLER